MNAAWIGYLPRFVRARLEGRPTLQAILGNSAWLAADKILRIGVGLLVGIWIARYLGPHGFGLWNYAIAFTALFGAVASLGLDAIVVRDLVGTPAKRDSLLGTAFALKLAAGLLLFPIVLGASFVIPGGGPPLSWLIGITAAALVFQAPNVIGFYFQAKVQSKFAVYASGAAFVLAAAANVAMLTLRAPLIAFVWIALAEVVLASCFLIVAYGRRLDLRNWRYDGTVARDLLRQGWPLLLSGVAALLYMRIDQVMIGALLDEQSVGLFSAAVRISEVWYFIPMAVATSVLPAIVETKALSEAAYRERVQTLITTLTWIGICVAVLVTLGRRFIVVALYGPAFEAAAGVLAVHTWAGIFVAMGVTASNWFVVERLQRLALYRTLGGAIVNVGLNVWLIPAFGIGGAAVATVVSQACAAFLLDGLSSKTRPIFWMKVRALNPWSLVPALVGR